MDFRPCSALLLLLSACASTEPKPLEQIAIPWVAPLAAPKPVAFPVPVGLTPPATIMVDPAAQTQEEPGVSRSPEKSGSNRAPPVPATSAPRPECIPEVVPHLGGDLLHNQCADKVPLNGVSGFDVLVNGKRFDAMQIPAGVLWEVKTDNFDTYTAALRKIVIAKQVTELQRDRDLARACGYRFAVGVRSATHRAVLRDSDPSLTIVVMDWC